MSDLEKRVEKLEKRTGPSGAGCVLFVLFFAFTWWWPVAWDAGWTAFKPFWFPDRVSPDDYRKIIKGEKPEAKP